MNYRTGHKMFTACVLIDDAEDFWAIQYTPILKSSIKMRKGKVT